MGAFSGEQQLCPCYEECQEFQKLVELKDSGLVIYCHRTRADYIKQGEAVESTSKDVFILHNKKEVKIPTSDLIAELEKKNISCPRCRKTFEHAQKLMQELKSIEKKIVIGICDHCRKKVQMIKNQYCTCNDVVTKFKSVIGEQKEDIRKYVKIWLSKMGHLLKDGRTVSEPKPIKHRAHSDLYISRGLNKPAPRHEPKIQQMFISTAKSDMNINSQMREADRKEDYSKHSVAFCQPIKSMKTSFSHTSHETEKRYTIIPCTSLLDSETTLKRTYKTEEPPRASLKEAKEWEEIFEDRPSMDAKDELKRRHDYNLRQMMRLEKDSGLVFSVSKRPNIYELPKIAPWEQKESKSKYNVESETDIKIPTKTEHYIGSRRSRDLNSQSKRLVKFSEKSIPGTSQKYLRDPNYEQRKSEKFDYGRSKKNIKKLDQHNADKFHHKTKKLLRQVDTSKESQKNNLKTDYRDNGIKRQFSFFFPKVMETEEKQVQLDVSSAHLINYIQEKLRTQDEKKQHKKDDVQLLEDDQKIEEKKVQPEDKKGSAVEDQSNYEKEQEELAEDKAYDEKETIRSLPDSIEEMLDKTQKGLSSNYKFEKDEVSNNYGVSHKYRKLEPQYKNQIDEEKAAKKTKPEQQEVVYGLSPKARKDLKFKPEQRYKVDDLKNNELKKSKEDSKYMAEIADKSDKILRKTKVLTSKLQKEDKTYKLLQKAKKDLKAKPEQRHTNNEVLDKTIKDGKGKSDLKENNDGVVMERRKKDVKGISELNGENEKMEIRNLGLKATKYQKGNLESKDLAKKKDKDLKPEREQIDEIGGSGKPKKELIAKYKQTENGVEKEKKTKTKEEERDEERREKKTFKKQVIYKGEQLPKESDVQPKNRKSAIVKQESHDKITVSLSKIIKKTNKDRTEITVNDNDNVYIRQEKENKMKPGKEKAEIENEQKERLKQIEQLRREKEALKKQVEKEQLLKEKVALKKQVVKESHDEITVSLSKIIKKTNKDKKEITVNENDIIDIRQEKENKMKSGKEMAEIEKEQKERLKQIEQLRKEKEALKKQVAKEQLSKDKVVSSKTGKSNKINKKSSDVIEVPLSKIYKEINKGKKEMIGNENEFVEIKQEVSLKAQDINKKQQSKDKTSKEETEFKKLPAQHIKEKALVKMKELDHERQEAKEKELKMKEQLEQKAKPADLKMGDIKMKHISDHERILEFVQIKQAALMKPSDIIEHKCHHGINVRVFCPLCYNSELEIEVMSLDNKVNIPTEPLKDIIIGEKVHKIKRCVKEIKEPEIVLHLYRNFCFDSPKGIAHDEDFAQNQSKQVPKTIIDMEPGKGILRYALSDRAFIEKGWTVLPTEKVVRKMNVYRMRPAHPEFDWFEHNKNKRLITYDSGERLAEFDDNGRGRWYYRNGRLALDYYDAEETNAQQRFVIYSSGEPDERGRTHPITVLATFDYLGNGIVFDHGGKIRLKYNQTEGVVLDRTIGPVSHWKWHTLNDPPVLQQVMIDTQLPHKDPDILKLGPPADKKTRPDNEEMLAIEFDNFIKEKSKKLSQKFKPFQIKMKALKINEHFSLRVLDQATVYLIFRDGTTNLKLNIGMILDHKEIVDTDTAEVGEVSNSIEQFPACTDSLASLQRSVAYAQRYERQHAERERRLRRPEPCPSADLLTAAASPPLKLPMRTMSTGSSSCTGYCCRKPTNNLYYNTRI